LPRPYQRHNGIFEKTLLNRLKIGHPLDVHIIEILTPGFRFSRNFSPPPLPRAAGRQSAGVDVLSITANSVNCVRGWQSTGNIASTHCRRCGRHETEPHRLTQFRPASGISVPGTPTCEQSCKPCDFGL
jgi:hypothetical protein